MMVIIGIIIGLGLNSVLTKIGNWIQDEYIESYTNEIIDEIEKEEIQKILKA